MGAEDQIRYELLQGTDHKDLIKRGYKKSTVYKVRQTIHTITKHLSPPQWSIEYIRFDKPNGYYKSGEAVRISFDLKNKSERDLYVKNIGIQTEWMKKDDIIRIQEINDVVKSWPTKHVTISFPIPKEFNLKESKIWFIMEGEFLPKEDMPIMTRISPTSLLIDN